MLETAAEFDTATGGYRRSAQVFPQVMRITASGIGSIAEAELEPIYRNQLQI